MIKSKYLRLIISNFLQKQINNKRYYRLKWVQNSREFLNIDYIVTQNKYSQYLRNCFELELNTSNKNSQNLKSRNGVYFMELKKTRYKLNVPRRLDY